MKNTVKIIAGLIIIGLCIYGYEQLIVKPRQQKVQAELRKEKIKNDTLNKIKDGYYTKLVADTLTIKQLRKKVDSLGIEAKNPKYVEVIKLVPKEVIKPVDNVSIKDSMLTLEDSYPDKTNPFIRYTSLINLNTKKGEGQFTFPNALEINIAAEEQQDGTYKIHSKVPEWVKIKSLDVQSLPKQQEKRDNFGFLLGVDYTTDFDGLRKGVKPNAYLRFNKVYIGGGISTLGNGSIGFKIEL